MKTLCFSRHFTEAGSDPFDRSCGRSIPWSLRVAHIEDSQGHAKFHRDDVSFPAFFSDNAVNVASYQYFGVSEDGRRETSLRKLIERVSMTLVEKGVQLGYFDDENGTVFRDELNAILVNQIAAFNSPVWYNVGLYDPFQASACFIQRVEDSIDGPGGLMELQANESRLFKGGSGTGTNFSNIRSSKEPVSGGGIASGPVSFMAGYDAWAGTIKSGGKTRRAAKINVLEDWHPDILPFVRVKPRMEELAHGLMASGACDPDADWNDEDGAYAHVRYQNANHTVSVSDAFMRAVEGDGPWELKAVTTGETLETVQARDLFGAIVDAAWRCADPGLQFRDTINRWNTLANSGPIRSSNPCGEFFGPDDTACNLASINVLKFLREDRTFDLAGLNQTVRVLITAMDILCESSSYPTGRIAANAHAMRQLGLGYANLGAALMCCGLPYDSEEARRVAAALTAYLTASSYLQSSRLAETMGSFPAYAVNIEPMHAVLKRHAEAASALYADSLHAGASQWVQDLCFEALSAWTWAEADTARYGIRNSQVTLYAPTGTISFLMGCATTGIEPDYALLKLKKLAQGGYESIVNPEVGRALRALGYGDREAEEIVAWTLENGTPVGCPLFAEEHAPVFDTANAPFPGGRFIAPMGHVRMMAAVQPFLSGGISKTINLPNSATREDIAAAYMAAWKMGLKGVTVYRDGCKSTQPLNAAKVKESQAEIRSERHGAEAEGDAVTAENRTASEATVDAAGTLWEVFAVSKDEQVQGAVELVREQEATIRSLQEKVAELTLALHAQTQSVAAPQAVPERRRLPKTRKSITHKGNVGGQEFYFTVGLDEQGRPRELFTNVSKAGSTLNGFCEVFGILVSLLLQYNVPLPAFTSKMRNLKFDPQGFTDNASYRQATSIPDYIAHWMGNAFPEDDALPTPATAWQTSVIQRDTQGALAPLGAGAALATARGNGHAPKAPAGYLEPDTVCPNCGQAVKKQGCACPLCGQAMSCG